MGKRTKRKKFHLIKLLTALLAVVVGFLFSLSAINNGGRTRVRSNDLRSAVRAQTMAVQQAQEQNKKLQEEILQHNQSLVKPADLGAEGEIVLASQPVTGPGLVVELTDAKVVDPAENPDIFVVHQQDVEAVMNALWAGGAEAMTVQDSRITLTSKIRCVGNVIYVNGEVFSPPFKIAAIGDPKALQAALKADEAMQIYQQYVQTYGLGYTEKVSDKLIFPAETKRPVFQIATTVETS